MRKKKSQMQHLKMRWAERVGLPMSHKLHDDIVLLIKRGESIPIRRTSNRVSIHQVDVDGSVQTVVYDKIRKQIVTVLPRE